MRHANVNSLDLQGRLTKNLARQADLIERTWQKKHNAKNKHRKKPQYI
jgi:hypothetical protein